MRRLLTVFALFGESRGNSSHVSRSSPEEQHVYKFELRSLTARAQFVDGEHVLSSRDCRDDIEHRGNHKCARAGVQTGNSPYSGCGKNPPDTSRGSGGGKGPPNPHS